MNEVFMFTELRDTEIVKLQTFALQIEEFKYLSILTWCDLTQDEYNFKKFSLQIELATGKFPYDTWRTPFEQLKQVVKEDPPKLPAGKFSPEFEDFIVQW